MNKKLTYEGAEIYYTTSGSGTTVILLHGFLEDLSMWDELGILLSKTNTVIAIDLPGFGESGIISTNHSMNLMAKTVAAVIRAEDIHKCTIVGHSMGGYVALAFAKLFENKLDGIVLFHSQAAADDNDTKKNRDRTIKIVESNHADFISSFIPSLFAEENVARLSIEIQQIVNKSMLTKNEGVIAALAGMRDREDHLDLLSQLEIPVLFIVGKKDSRIPLGKIKNQMALPKKSESLVLNDVGHMGFIEAKKDTFNAIAKFVTK